MHVYFRCNPFHDVMSTFKNSVKLRVCLQNCQCEELYDNVHTSIFYCYFKN